MTLPSLALVSQDVFARLPQEEKIAMMIGAIRIDLPLAHEWFKSSLHQTHLKVDPLSELGKQISRCMASDALRISVCSMLNVPKIMFANCCDVIIDPPSQSDPFEFQLSTQNGQANYANC